MCDTMAAVKHPIDIRTVGDRELLITWDDGHRSLFAYRYLRLNCPCAACRDEWSGRRLITLDKIAADVRPLEWEQVGNYALRFKWSDSHETGIYSFDFLREVCPCSSCQNSNAS